MYIIHGSYMSLYTLLDDIIIGNFGDFINHEKNIKVYKNLFGFSFNSNAFCSIFDTFKNILYE